MPFDGLSKILPDSWVFYSPGFLDYLPESFMYGLTISEDLLRNCILSLSPLHSYLLKFLSNDNSIYFAVS